MIILILDHTAISLPVEWDIRIIKQLFCDTSLSIQITDDDRYADSAAQLLLQQCKDKIFNKPENETTGSRTLPDGGFCPNDCSGNGNCVDSVCQCNGGFSGPDCSRDDSKWLF